MFSITSAIILLTTGPAAPVPKATPAPVLYFPTEVGTKWDLRISGQPNGKDINHSYTITAVEKKDGDVIVKTKRRVDGATAEGDVIRLNKDGQFDAGEPDERYDPPLPVLKYPLDKDATWKWAGKYGKEQRSETRTVLGTEEVKVPAGTFKGVKVKVVETRTTRKGATEEYKSIEWYAPDVGRVKWVSANLVEEMLLFVPAKK